MTRILISIEDETAKRKAEEIADRLRALEFECDPVAVASSPMSAEADIIIFDAAAAGLWASSLRADISKSDILLMAIVTETGIDENLLPLLDDLIFWPVSAAELKSRIRRLLLKSGKDDGKRIIVGNMIIDLESYRVIIEKKAVALTFKEYELLKYMAGRPGRVFDRQTLLNQIWDYDYYGGTRTVDVHIRRLRAKLGSRYGSMIQTVRQVGYRFSQEPVDLE